MTECEEACRQGRMGDMYKILRQLGTRGNKKLGMGGTLTAEDFREQFESVSAERYEVDPSVIEGVIERAKDLRMDAEAIVANEGMNVEPEREEIEEAMKEMKESAPGEDGVRIGYIRNACEDVRTRVVEMVQYMWGNRANKWEKSLKEGTVVALFKKGDRNEAGNYRGVCLLAMGSRVLARVIAKRLRWWAEHLGLMDESQAGFRRGRSTADATQMMVRVNEDVNDYRKRVEGNGGDFMNEDERPVARLLDLRKAYPRVSKPGMWKLLERYGLGGKCLETIVDLHETTEYRVKGREGLSKMWMPARGLREGCATSPILFNIYHQAVMWQAEDERRMNGGEVGIEWKWVPGSAFAGAGNWEKNSEAKGVRLGLSLFADDTTIVGKREEIESGTRVMKGMGRFEERCNDDKEEVLDAGWERMRM